MSVPALPGELLPVARGVSEELRPVSTYLLPVIGGKFKTWHAATKLSVFALLY